MFWRLRDAEQVLLKIFPHRDDLQQPSNDFGEN